MKNSTTRRPPPVAVSSGGSHPTDVGVAPLVGGGISPSPIIPVIRTRANRKVRCAILSSIVLGIVFVGMSLGFEFGLGGGGGEGEATAAASLSQAISANKNGGEVGAAVVSSAKRRRSSAIGGLLPMMDFNRYLAEKRLLELVDSHNSIRGGLLKVLFISSQVASETIFINIASFRDRLCMESIREIYGVARNPERVFVGIVDQRVVGDQLGTPTEYYRPLPKLPSSTTTAPKNVDPESRATPTKFLSCYKNEFCPSDNIRSRVVWSTEARGPTFGRFVAGLLFQGETFYMMMDSHSRFLPGYDEFMILDVLRMRDSYVSTPSTLTGTFANGDGSSDSRYSSDAVGSAFASPVPSNTDNKLIGGVLSYYPSGFDLFSPPVDDKQQIMAMCKTAYVDSLSVLRNGAMWVPQSRRPLRQPNTAAGFLFSESTAQLKVPFDPYLDFVFDGEEILYTARLYTAGFDSYLPGRTYIFHHYNRKHAPRYWGVAKTPFGKIQPFTRQRVHYFLKTHEKNALPKQDKSKDEKGSTTANNDAATVIATRKPDKLIVDYNKAKGAGLTISEELYGMGTVRSLERFYSYSHVNTSTWDVDQNGLCDPMSKIAKSLMNKFKE